MDNFLVLLCLNTPTQFLYSRSSRQTFNYPCYILLFCPLYFSSLLLASLLYAGLFSAPSGGLIIHIFEILLVIRYSFVLLLCTFVFTQYARVTTFYLTVCIYFGVYGSVTSFYTYIYTSFSSVATLFRSVWLQLLFGVYGSASTFYNGSASTSFAIYFFYFYLFFWITI